MDAPSEMVEALNVAAPEILQIGGVNGLDIGRDDAGEPTMRILVGDPESPPDGLPESVGGFSYVLVAGAPVLESIIPDGAKYDPLIGGIQIGPRAIVGGVAGSGTLGCVLRASGTGDLVAVSNAHVMCGAVGDVMQQPAPSTDPPPLTEQLGKVLMCQMPTSPTFLPDPDDAPVSGFFDGATCSIEGRNATVGEIADIGTATAISSPQLGNIVRKRGYRTGLTHGVVEGIFGAYMVQDGNGNAKWWMLGQVCIAMIPDLGLNPLGIWSDSGDSGSVIVNQSDEIIALHWGGDGNGRGYATDFSTLAIALGVSL